MKKIATLFVLFLIVSNANAQKGIEFVDGWVKTKKGDTLKSKICWENAVTKEHLDKIFFLDATGAKKRYGVDKITSFGTNDKTFDFIVVEGVEAPMPMQRMISGELNLYKAWFKKPESTPSNFSYEVAIFLNKKEEKQFIEVMDGGFEKQMKKYFKDNKDFAVQIKENGWGISDIEKIVASYNEQN
jgi:hypothetical protein